MATTSNKARRFFAPLNIGVAVVCQTGDSPFQQTTDGTNYYPDRTSKPCKAYPMVSAYASDNSWDSERSNLTLMDMKWEVNYNNGTSWVWADITTLTAWTGKYEIDQSSTNDRGTLTIKRNLGSNEKVQLRFSANLYDYRTESKTYIVADAVTLSTVDKGEDMYGIGIGDSTNVSYNPYLDQLALYEYKVANGLVTASDSARAACFDGEQYERTIPIDVYKGKDRITSGYVLKLYRTGSTTELAASTASNPNEIMAFSLTQLKLDLRLVEKNDYTLKLYVNNLVRTQIQFSVARFYPPIPQPTFVNHSDIGWNEVERQNKAVITLNSRQIEYPGRILNMTWRTTAMTGEVEGTQKQWQDGDTCLYRVEDTGLGITEQDWLDEQLDYSQKKAADYATDGDGNYLTDESGNMLIE